MTHLLAWLLTNGYSMRDYDNDPEVKRRADEYVREQEQP